MCNHRGNQADGVNVLAGTGADFALPFRISELLIGDLVGGDTVIGGIDDAGTRGEAKPMPLAVAEVGGNVGADHIAGQRLGHTERLDGVQTANVDSHDDIGRGVAALSLNALAKALAKDLGRFQSNVEDIRLVDFKVRITQGGTEAVTRVIIDSEDGQGRRWSTVGVSANIVDASFEALLDAIRWKLVQDGVT